MGINVLADPGGLKHGCHLLLAFRENLHYCHLGLLDGLQVSSGCGHCSGGSRNLTDIHVLISESISVLHPIGIFGFKG